MESHPFKSIDFNTFKRVYLCLELCFNKYLNSSLFDFVCVLMYVFLNGVSLPFIAGLFNIGIVQM